MANSKQLAVGNQNDIAGKHAELEQKKRKAVEDEDFDSAASIKAQQLELEQTLRVQGSTEQIEQELQELRKRKQLAVHGEQFEEAAHLRERERELEERRCVADGPALEAERHAVLNALRLLEDSGPEVLLLAFERKVATCVASTLQTRDRFWMDVSDDLRSMLSKHDL
eukprot:5423814-Amphidinium_carterae.1